MVREIKKSSKVREKSGNFKIMFYSNPSKIKHTDMGLMMISTVFSMQSNYFYIYVSLIVISNPYFQSELLHTGS